jgi:hypothetical protein
MGNVTVDGPAVANRAMADAELDEAAKGDGVRLEARRELFCAHTSELIEKIQGLCLQFHISPQEKHKQLLGQTMISVI